LLQFNTAEYFTCQGVVHVESIEFDFLQMQAAIDEDSNQRNQI
jgi:5-hydroxyisourate hydrolase-like protein (transthyretin family)